MDPRTNPYAPGAGTQPPELVGRDDIIEKAAIALDRCRNGLPSRGLLMVGLRGVGKTVLLTRIAQETEARGFAVVSVETPEKRSLPALIIPALRSALLKLDRAAASELVKKTLRILGGFVAAMKLIADSFGVTRQAVYRWINKEKETSSYLFISRLFDQARM